MSPMPSRLLACLLAFCAFAVMALPPDRWECRTRDAAGNCVGLSTYREPDGTRLQGLRSTVSGKPGWSGLLVRYHPNGERSECQADAAGSCQGETTLHHRSGLRETGMQKADKNGAAWNGRMSTHYPNGDRLDCEVDARGACNGLATLWWHDGGRMQGRIVTGKSGPQWQGRVVFHHRGGDREECAGAPDGQCLGETTYTYADGTRLLGRKTQRGDKAVWTGEVVQVFTSGKRMRCDASRTRLCEDDTQIPVDMNGRPLGRIPR